MKQDHELELNAYVDGELTSDQQAEFLEAMREDPALARAACELSALKAQVRLAYAEPPQPRRRTLVRQAGRWQAVAAGLSMLAVGLAGGWVLNESAGPVDANRLVLLDHQGRGQAPAVAGQEETRIVFHLTNADPLVAGELLDEVEGMLRAYQQDGRPLRVEVVSHSDGLDFLRLGLTRHRDRIHELAGQFANLTFVACKNTIDRLEVENGIEVHLVPDAEVIESGVSHVVKRQRQGWSYIRV
jgi:intracellular sulfur oxidation DsrE/DsrF family protein